LDVVLLRLFGRVRDLKFQIAKVAIEAKISVHVAASATTTDDKTGSSNKFVMLK
jgi:hypothetical protein